MNIDNIGITDIVTLDDNKKCVVLGKAVYCDVNYLYLMNQEDYSMIFAAVTGNKLVFLNNKEDKAIIDQLMPLFLQSTTKMVMELNNKQE